MRAAGEYPNIGGRCHANERFSRHLAAPEVNRYRVTINAQQSRFCAVYDVAALDPAKAVYSAMAHAELLPGGDYEIITARQECNLGNTPEVQCLSVTA